MWHLVMEKGQVMVPVMGLALARMVDQMGVQPQNEVPVLHMAQALVAGLAVAKVVIMVQGIMHRQEAVAGLTLDPVVLHQVMVLDTALVLVMVQVLGLVPVHHPVLAGDLMPDLVRVHHPIVGQALGLE
jgi:hypothetical protein